jgi:long-chain acyl-CoA synthetase
LGERVHAIVVHRGPSEVTLEKVIAFCDGRIADYKKPRNIELRFEPLPLSGAGKILKNELRTPYWIGTARGVN